MVCAQRTNPGLLLLPLQPLKGLWFLKALETPPPSTPRPMGGRASRSPAPPNRVKLAAGSEGPAGCPLTQISSQLGNYLHRLPAGGTS